MFLNFEHFAHEGSRRGGVTQSPPGHGISLRESIDRHRPFPHARHAGSTLRLHAVRYPVVNLIGNQEQIVSPADFGDALQLVPA